MTQRRKSTTPFDSQGKTKALEPVAKPPSTKAVEPIYENGPSQNNTNPYTGEGFVGPGLVFARNIPAMLTPPPKQPGFDWAYNVNAMGTYWYIVPTKPKE